MTVTHIDSSVLRPIALELRYLRLVYAIQELGSLTKAAERLNVTQSALSHQLREIEDRLGVDLFIRAGKKLVATEAGELLGRRAGEILASVVDAEDDLVHRARERRGTIRLTTECYTCYHWLPPLLKRFRKPYPDVSVQIVADATGRSIDALLEGTVDVALTTRAPKRSDLRFRHLFDDELLLVTAPDHRLSSKKFVVPSDLASETVILYSKPPNSHFYEQFFGGTGVAPKEVIQVQLTEAMISMIHAGLGVGALARWAVQAELKKGTVAAVQLGRSGLHREWKAVTRAGDRRPQYIDDFLDLVVEQSVPGRFIGVRAG
jgi:LysR family transcriptional regulator for metE and metH